MSHADEQRSTWTYRRVQYRISLLVPIEVIERAFQPIESLVDLPFTSAPAVRELPSAKERDALAFQVLLRRFDRLGDGRLSDRGLKPIQPFGDLFESAVRQCAEFRRQRLRSARQQRGGEKQMAGSPHHFDRFRDVVHVLDEIGTGGLSGRKLTGEM